MSESVKFDGQCPFLTCSETEAHEHEVCQTCGAVRHGNIFCADCRAFNSLPDQRGEPCE